MQRAETLMIHLCATHNSLRRTTDRVRREPRYKRLWPLSVFSSLFNSALYTPSIQTASIYKLVKQLQSERLRGLLPYRTSASYGNRLSRLHGFIRVNHTSDVLHEAR